MQKIASKFAVMGTLASLIIRQHFFSFDSKRIGVEPLTVDEPSAAPEKERFHVHLDNLIKLIACDYPFDIYYDCVTIIFEGSRNGTLPSLIWQKVPKFILNPYEPQANCTLRRCCWAFLSTIWRRTWYKRSLLIFPLSCGIWGDVLSLLLTSLILE